MAILIGIFLVLATIAAVAARKYGIIVWETVEEPEPLIEYPPEPPSPQIPAPEPPLPPSPPEPMPEPIPAPVKSNREHLYEVAKACIGKDMSPLDRAPDTLGCMESLDGVWLEAFGEHLLEHADRLSTARGYAAMRVHPRLKLVKEDFLPGDIVISPTGLSTKGSPNGHTGIRGIHQYMSNDSSNGKWMANYNLPNWKAYFGDKLGFPTFHFRVLD